MLLSRFSGCAQPAADDLILDWNGATCLVEDARGMSYNLPSCRLAGHKEWI